VVEERGGIFSRNRARGASVVLAGCAFIIECYGGDIELPALHQMAQKGYVSMVISPAASAVRDHVK